MTQIHMSLRTRWGAETVHAEITDCLTQEEEEDVGRYSDRMGLWHQLPKFLQPADLHRKRRVCSFSVRRLSAQSRGRGKRIRGDGPLIVRLRVARDMAT